MVVSFGARVGAFLGLLALACGALATETRSDPWAGDLSPIGAQDWNRDRAAHLLERAGFGGPPEEVDALTAVTPEQAVAGLVNYRSVDNSHSCITRLAATRGVCVKPVT